MSNLSRRNLLGSSAGLAGAAIVAGQVTSHEVHLPPLHASSEAAGIIPNPDPPVKRLGVAVVGLGHLALEEIIPAFGETKHVKLTALVSGERDKAAAIAAQYGVPETNIYDYRTFDRLKENSSVDIVYIVLPNSMHAEYTIRAAKAGKHVLCEKPMATSVRECEQMIKACREAGRKLMIAYRLQYHPAHRTAIEWARTQKFGAIRYMTAMNGQNDAPNGQWRQIKSLAGGGSLPDVGLYCLNAFRYITGEEPYEVTGQLTQPKDDPRFREIEDISTFTLRFPSGVFANGSAGYSMHESRYLRIMTTDAWFGLDPAFGYNNIVLKVNRKAGKASSEEQQRFTPHSHFAAEMDHFGERLKQNQESRTPGEEGLQDHRVMEAIYHAAAGGGAVKLPLVKEQDSTRGPALAKVEA